MSTIWPLLQNAISNLSKNKTRSFLTMLGMIIGVTSVILLVAIGTGLRNMITNQFESMGSNNLYVMPGDVDLSRGPASHYVNKTSKLKFKYIYNLSHLGSPINLVGGATENFAQAKRGSNSESVTVEGVNENTLKVLNIEIATGRDLNKQVVRDGKKVAVIGQTVVKNMFNNSDPLGQKISINGDTSVTIIGTYAKKGGGLGGATDMDNLIFIPYPVAGQIFDKQAFDSLVIQLNSTEDIAAAKTKITHALLKLHLKPNEFTIIEPSQVLSTINTILSAVTLALGGIAAISLLVGGIGIMNIMLVSVTERFKEIGLRKAVGATFNDILLLFLIESVLISFLGGTIGILLAIGLTLVINQFINAQITLWPILLAFGFSAIVGIIFGVAPAIKAAKLNPIKALRYE